MKLYQIAGTFAAAAILASSSYAAAQTAPVTGMVKFSVMLPSRNPTGMTALMNAQTTAGSVSYHQWLSPAQAAAQYGADPAAVASVSAALTAAGFTVTGTHIFTIDATGPASLVNSTLHTTLVSVPTTNGGTRIVSSSARTVLPSAVTAAGGKILSFATVPERMSFAQLVTPAVAVSLLAPAAPANRTSTHGGYYYNDLKQAYDYPSYQVADGTNAHVAILMENSAKTTDVTAMFTANKFQMTTGKNPNFTQYYTQDCYDLTADLPNTDVPYPTAGLYTSATPPTGYTFNAGCKFSSSGSLEASLDTQMVVGGAPGALTSLVTIPDLSDASILDGYLDIMSVPDPSNSNVAFYHIISNSFGGCELLYTAAYNNGYDFTFIFSEYDQVIQLAALEGITFIYSSGDEAGVECPSTAIVPNFLGAKFASAFVPSVSSPSNDPNVISVGGGNLETVFTSGSLTSTYVSENGNADPEKPYDIYGLGANVSGGYWGAGGGASAVLARPAYQSQTKPDVPFRSQPDLGMMVGGCPSTATSCGAGDSSVEVFISGRASGVIGTSVSAPEFAGALALYVGKNGPQGYFNPWLYSKFNAQVAAGGATAPAASQFYRMNIPGFNGVVTTTTTAHGGYNYVYGNGSPDVRLMFFTPATAAAGTPETASNP